MSVDKKIEVVSLIGAGIMGEMIAMRAALFDYKVRLYDIDSDRLTKVEKRIRSHLRKNNKRDNIENVSYHLSLEETVSGADLIIEAIPENLELKKTIFKQLDELAPPYAILATNSSSIPVSRLENVVERKDKLLNIHFYQNIPMVDIMRGSQTSDEIFEMGKNWIESIEFTPLMVKKECMGFVFNRIWRAIKKECLKIWAGGHADIETVDTAWKLFTGMGIGPFQLMDLVGLDVVHDIEMSYYNESGDPKDKPPKELLEMVEKGLLGVKSGEGFYKWR